MNKVNMNEAPKDFYAVEKKYKGYNICIDCDARQLCQKNIENWCEKNTCMSYVIEKNDGTEIKRKDMCSVIFIKKGGQHETNETD